MNAMISDMTAAMAMYIVVLSATGSVHTYIYTSMRLFHFFYSLSSTRNFQNKYTVNLKAKQKRIFLNAFNIVKDYWVQNPVDDYVPQNNRYNLMVVCYSYMLKPKTQNSGVANSKPSCFLSV